MNWYKCDLTWSIVIAIVIASCGNAKTPAPVISEDSLITGQPCFAPCWQGLTPGESTYDEALVFMQQSPFVNNNLLQSEELAGGFLLSWWWANEKDDYSRSNMFTFSGERILESMHLIPNTDITIGQIINIYGKPSTISIGTTAPRDPFDKSREGVLFDAMFVEYGFEVRWFQEIDIDQLPLKVCPLLDSVIEFISFYTLEVAKSTEQDRKEFGGRIVEGGTIFQTAENETTVSCIDIK